MAHRPLVGIVVSFSLGVFTDSVANIPFFLTFPVALSSSLVYIFVVIFLFRPKDSQPATGPGQYRRRFTTRSFGNIKGHVSALFVLIFLTGMSYHHLRFYSHAGNNISNFVSTEKIPILLRGVVIAPPVSRHVEVPLASSGNHHKEMLTFLLRAEAIECNSENAISKKPVREWKNITGVIKANVYSTTHGENTPADTRLSLSEKLNYGDSIELTGSISTPSTARNPGQFDYKHYLKRQIPRIDAVASIADINSIRTLTIGHGNFFYSFIYSLKKKLHAVIEEHTKKRSAPIVASILLGERHNVPRKLMDGFLKTGAIHFLAISGLHVGILVVSLHYLLKLFMFNTRQLSVIIILIIFLYAVITGMKSPIIRAGIMVATYYGSFIISRRWNLQNSIAAAVLIILFINPSDLFNIGFQLSILAVLGIIYISNRIENFFWKSTLLIEKLQAKEEMSEIWFLFKIYCRKTLCVSLGAWIAVMPLIAYYFHIITPFSIFLNIIIFPLIWLILVGGFIVLATGLLSPILAKPFAWLISYAEITLENLILLFSTKINTFFYISQPLTVWIVIYYLIVIFFIIRERFRIRMAHMIIATFVISNIFLFSGFFISHQNSLKLTCFDVRHGACFFIQFSNGKNILFDAGTQGNYDVGKFVISPFLRQEGIKKIDTIVISHEHDDHCNGIPSVIEEFKVRNALVNKFFLQYGNKSELLNLFSEEKIKTGLLAKGLEIKGYEPARITILNPPDKDTLKEEGFPVNTISINDSSTVLLIDYTGYRILLCADIGKQGIEMLLSENDNPEFDVSADIIQVPHHGRFTVNSRDLVKSVKPKHAIINGPADGISSSTIADYEEHGVIIHKTHDNGAVTFKISKDGIKISTFL